MQKKKAGTGRRKYDSEFKEEVLKMISNGRPVREIPESLGNRLQTVFYNKHLKPLEFFNPMYLL